MCPSCGHPPHAAGECNSRIQKHDYIGIYYIGCACIFTSRSRAQCLRCGDTEPHQCARPKENR